MRAVPRHREAKSLRGRAELARLEALANGET